MDKVKVCLVVVFLVLNMNSIFSQNNKSTIGFFISPESYQFYFSKSVFNPSKIYKVGFPDGTFSDNYIKGFSGKEDAINYSFGLTYQYKLINKLVLKSGIMYNNMGNTVSYSYVTLNDDSSEGPAIPDSRLAINYSEKSGLIGLPILFSYNPFQFRKISFMVNAGILLQKRIYNKITTRYFDRAIVDSQNRIYSKIFYSGMIELGIDYKINDKISCSILPFYKKVFSSITSLNYNTKQSYGINFCLNYHI